MTDVKIPTSPTAEANRRPSRGPLVAAVVAIAVVAVGFMLLDGPSEQEHTELAAPLDTPVDLAYRIIEARNAFDADALSDLLEPAEYVFRVEPVDITGFAGWLEAFDWRLVDPTCEETTDVAVTCRYTITNRLTRHAGLEGEVDGMLYLIFESGALTGVSEFFTVGQYSSQAFEPFRSWVRQNHPEAVEVMWDASGPRLTDESIRLFDEMLTEYTGEG